MDDRGREQYPESANLEVETDNESSSETLAEVPTESDIDRHQTFANTSSLLLPPMMTRCQGIFASNTTTTETFRRH